LNLEAVLTAVIAWVVFKENADRRIVLGMVAIVAGGIALGWPAASAAISSAASSAPSSAPPGAPSGAPPSALGPVLVGVACLCWAIDNNLTRKVSASDALFIAATKGLIAGAANTLWAIAMGAALPRFAAMALTMGVGLLGYGVSLVLFVLALRGLGTARTGAYFSTAPFIGAAVALLVFSETTTPAFWIAAALMGVGVALHLTEHHAHEHSHEPLEHAHEHTHDAHHQHTHASGLPGSTTIGHSHLHTHADLRHSHPHYPDIHHRHGH
jgi:drug/metabolite transporter (DMT)-like permease